MGWKRFKAAISHFMAAGNFLGAIFAYIAAAPVLIGVLAKFSKPFRDAGYGPADAAIIGLIGAVGLACILVLLFLAFAVAFRLLRHGQSGSSRSELVREPFDGHGHEQWLTPGSPQINSLNRDAVALRASVEALKKAVDSAASKTDVDALSLRIDECTNAIGEARNMFVVNMGEQDIKLQSADARLENIYDRFLALGNREFLGVHVAKIHEWGDELSALTAATGPIDDRAWNEWEAKQDKWRREIYAWLTVAQNYVAPAEAEVMDTSEKRYLVPWTFDEKRFPSSEAIFKFKTFRIIYSNFHPVRSEVDRRLHKILFR